MKTKNISNLNDNQIEILTKCALANSDRPVEKSELITATGLTERGVRIEIGNLRDMGYRICCTSNNSGYWIARSDEDYQRFRNDYLSRAKVIQKRIRAMDRMNPKQIEMVM